MTGAVPILIIGGGIGGLTAALALARAGFPAHIVERSPEFGEIGAGIQLAPNALRILDGLGVLPELAALAVRPSHLVLMHADTGEHRHLFAAQARDPASTAKERQPCHFRRDPGAP